MIHPPSDDRAPSSADRTARGENGASRALRAKYLDFCSARLSEIFLSLSDERIYDLMEEAARDSGLNPADLGFGRMVRLATEKLWHSVPLPDFESWSEEYREHPERYDPYLLGFTEEHRAEAAGEDAADPRDGPGGGGP